MQIEVVSARFYKGFQDYYFSPNGLELKNGDRVIVDTEKGKDLVTIVGNKKMIDASSLIEPLKNVVKKASDDEVKQAEENMAKASSLLSEIREIVKKENLEMKVVSVESNYNFSKLVINFTSEDRVDFRDLVKKLAEKYNIGNNITFTGKINNNQVIDLLRQSDIFIMVSKNETFGLSYLEAAASGNIIIAKKNDGIDGLLTDEENAFFVSANYKEIAACLRKICETETNKLNEIRTAAINIASRYTLSSAAENYLKNIK